MNEKITVDLSESELSLLLTALTVLERVESAHVRLAEIALRERNFGLAPVSRQSTAFFLADKLSDLMKAKDRPPAAALNACLG